MWKATREEHKQEEEQRKELIRAIVGRVTKRTYENASLVEQRAFDYLEKCVKTPRSFEKLVGFYETYENLRGKENKVSLKKLTKKSRIGKFVGQAKNLLDAVGLENLTGRKPIPLAQWKKGALGRIARAGSNFGSCDIASFLGMEPTHAILYLCKNNWKATRGLGIRKGTCANRHERSLTYALAGEIYEAIDFGFNVEESAQLVGTSINVVECAIVNRGEYSAEIRNSLRNLFSGRKSRKPYLTSEERKQYFGKTDEI